MIRDTISEIEARLQNSNSLSSEARRELTELLAKLKGEVTELARTHADQAASIDGFAQTSTHEATRSEKNEQLLKSLGVPVNPTLPMIKEYLSLNDLAKLAEDMNNSKDHEAKIEWGNFTKVDPEKTQGGVITGLNNKLGPLRSPNAMQILKTATPQELAGGAREINLADLRKPRTAIYVVLSETQASEYRILLEMFFGLAAIEMQSSTSKNATPVLMALDEAGNVSPPKLQDKLKIGRFRNTPYLLGFQDVSQIKNRFQENGGKAVLAGMKTQIFLPGIDPETVKVAVSGRSFSIAGSRARPKGAGARYQLMEIEYGPFQRRIELGHDVDAADATASYERGLLSVVLPLADRAAPQAQIAIEVRR